MGVALAAALAGFITVASTTSTEQSGLFRHLLETRGVAVYGKDRTRHTELASLSTLTVTALAPARGGDETTRALQPQPLVLASWASVATWLSNVGSLRSEDHCSTLTPAWVARLLRNSSVTYAEFSSPCSW